MSTMTFDDAWFAAVDKQALKCCRRLTDVERDEFFSGTSIFRGSKTLREALATITRGVHKGRRRDVYRINGREFTILWKLIRVYVEKQATISHWPHVKSSDYEDSISAIRERIITLLTFYGPRPSRVSFSSAMKVVTSQELINQANFRSRDTSYRILTTAVSLSSVGAP